MRVIDNAGAGEVVYTDEQVDLELEAELERRRQAAG